MKIFNLTDVATAQLEQSNMVNQTVVIAKTAIEAGASAEVAIIGARDLAALQDYVTKGILAANVLPAAYAVNKARSITSADTEAQLAKRRRQLAKRGK
jgi:hypothetical protein